MPFKEPDISELKTIKADKIALQSSKVHVESENVKRKKKHRSGITVTYNHGTFTLGHSEGQLLCSVRALHPSSPAPTVPHFARTQKLSP